MSARSRVALFALLALSVALGPVAAAGAFPSAVDGSANADQTTATPVDTIPPGTTAITIELEPDGDATWVVETRVDATTEEERKAFQTMANRYESGQLSPPWLQAARAAADAAERAAGRPMNVTDARTSSDVNTTTLRVQFTWTNFAREEGDHMVVDDAFNTTRGTWLDGLTAGQELTIELPDGYTVVTSPKAVQNGRFHWQGPQQFEPGYMEIVYSGDGTGSETPGNGVNMSLIWGGFFVLGLGIVVVGAYVFSSRQGGLPTSAPGDAGSDGPSTPGPSAAASADANGATATAGTVEPTNESTHDDGDTDADDDVDEELLSDEERVERLLESNGGRMKQANIVKETGWSNAKVSQLLSSMADEGAVDKLRIGRENLISFPDEDITDIDRD